MHLIGCQEGHNTSLCICTWRCTNKCVTACLRMCIHTCYKCWCQALNNWSLLWYLQSVAVTTCYWPDFSLDLLLIFTNTKPGLCLCLFLYSQPAHLSWTPPWIRTMLLLGMSSRFSPNTSLDQTLVWWEPNAMHNSNITIHDSLMLSMIVKDIGGCSQVLNDQWHHWLLFSKGLYGQWFHQETLPHCMNFPFGGWQVNKHCDWHV